MDKFGEKNALFVGQDVRANTIALRHKDSVKSLQTAIYRIIIFSENSCHTLGTYVPHDASDTTAPQQGQKRVLSGYYVPEFQNYEGKQNNKRAMSCGSRHVRLRVWRVPLVLPTYVQCFSCLTMPIEGMRSR